MRGHWGPFCTTDVELPFSGYLKRSLKQDVLLKQTKHPVTETLNPAFFHAALRLSDPRQLALWSCSPLSWLGGHPASCEGTLRRFMRDGVCVTATPWLALMGVLCRREQPGSQGLISLGLRSWCGQRGCHMGSAVWGNWESVSGALTSLS